MILHITEISTILTSVIILLLSCIPNFSSKKNISHSMVMMLIVVTAIGFYNLMTYNFSTCLAEDYLCPDYFSMSVKPLIIVSWLIIVVISTRYLIQQSIPLAEFYALGSLSTCGVLVLLDSQSIITLYLGLELISLPSYIMVALAPKDPLGKEAGIKYFMIGSIGSGLILFGFSWLYGLTGSIALPQITQSLSLLEASTPYSSIVYGYTLSTAMVIMFGVLIKLGVAPLHWWVPDTYQGANTPTTLFISTLPKFGIAAILYKILQFVFYPLACYNFLCQSLIFIGLISILWGNLSALTQQNVKRLLSYSSIAHMGIILVALSVPQFYTSDYNLEVVAYAYLIIYTLASLISFYVIIEVNEQYSSQIDLNTLRGLSQINPTLACFLLISLFSTAGIPPMAGFFAKLPIISLMVQNQYSYFAIVVMLLSAIGVGYYINIIKTIYFNQPAQNSPVIQNSKQLVFLLTSLSLLVMLLAIYPNTIIGYLT